MRIAQPDPGAVNVRTRLPTASYKRREEGVGRREERRTLVDAVNGLGLAESVGFGASTLWPSSMPLVRSETKSAETSAVPPLQVPLSYANRSTVTFATSFSLMPGKLALISSLRLIE